MEVFGCPVHINVPLNACPKSLFIDIETDEKDNLVGIGYTSDGINLYYRTVIDEEFKALLSKVDLIGHNIKFDAHLLKLWGVDIKSSQLVHDTMLMSYSMYGSSKGHALKQLADDLLEMRWSTYSEMVNKTETVVTKQLYDTWVTDDGKRRRKRREIPLDVIKEKQVKITLDKQPIEAVAAYCCSDVKATYDLFQFFQKNMDEIGFIVYRTMELPVMQVIFDMENRGINLDVKLLGKLDSMVSSRIAELKQSCKEFAGDINIGSSKQLAPILESLGFWLPTTNKGNKSVKKGVLELYKNHPFVAMLLEHSELKKLSTSFTQPLSELSTLPRVYPTFNQVRSHEEDQIGISTGRLSCSNPNLQQIPRRSDIAKEIRKLFIPDNNKVLLVADYSQIEPRVLAHIAGDEYLQDVFHSGKDMYLALIKGTKWELLENGRDVGKTFYLALSYGAQAKKLAKVFKCSVEEAQSLMQQCWNNIPKVREWQLKTIIEACKTGYVETLFGRKRYLPDINDDDFFTRSTEERRAINTPVQGSAADIMKLAMVKLQESGYPIQLVVHDEVLLSVDKDDAEMAMDDIKTIMESIVQLDVPLKVEIHQGSNWDETKG